MHRMHAPEVTPELLSLASKSNVVVSSYLACIVNGVRFITHDRDARLKTQNNGVSMLGTGQEIFYGQFQEILEFSYLNKFFVVLFRCKWFKCDSRHMITLNNTSLVRYTRMTSSYLLPKQSKCFMSKIHHTVPTSALYSTSIIVAFGT